MMSSVRSNSVGGLVAIDPSFRRTGLALFVPEKSSLIVRRVGIDPDDKSFVGVFDSSCSLSYEIVETIRGLCPQVSAVMMEVPPPLGMYSAGLYGLDVILAYRLLTSGLFGQGSLFVVGPSYLGHLHGTRSYHKSDSVLKARGVLRCFESAGVKLDLGRLSHDEAEAVLLLARLFVRQYSNPLSSALLGLIPNLAHEKEQELKLSRCCFVDM